MFMMTACCMICVCVGLWVAGVPLLKRVKYVNHRFLLADALFIVCVLIMDYACSVVQHGQHNLVNNIVGVLASTLIVCLHVMSDARLFATIV